MFAAASTTDLGIPSLLSVGTVVGLLVGYGFGFIHAVWRRAKGDYDSTRAVVPGLRAKKWAAWRTMVRKGALAGAAVIGLVVWLFVSASRSGAAP